MANSDHPSGASYASGSHSSSSLAGAQGAASAVSDQTQQAGQRAREEASRVAGQAQEQARAFLAEQKDVAARHIGDVANVLHQTVNDLRQRSPGAISDYAGRAAEGLDSFATALREQDVRSLIGSAEDFARRQPALFMAGTVALGFGLARFLKSSSGADRGQGVRGSQYEPSRQRGPAGHRPAGDDTEYRRHIAGDAPGSDESTQSWSGSAGGTAGDGGPSSPQYGTTRSSTSGARASAEEIERAMKKEIE